MIELKLYDENSNADRAKIREKVRRLCKRYGIKELHAYLRDLYGKNSEINQ